MFHRYKEDSLFAKEKKRRYGWLIALLILISILSGVFVYNFLLNAHAAADRQSVTIPNLSAKLEGFKILHISDLHGKLYGTAQENILSSLEGEKYHAVCITGDVTDKNGNPRAIIRLLKQFPEGVPVFLIPGDEDPNPIVSTGKHSAKADYILKIEEAGAVYLDAPHLVVYNGENIWFSPEMLFSLDMNVSKMSAEKRLEDLQKEEQTEKTQGQILAAEYQLDRLRRIEDAQRQMKPEDIQIALTHVPLSVEGLRNLHDIFADQQSVYISNISLVLAGHYNAGQWRLPYAGAVYVPEKFPLSAGGMFPGDTGLVGLQSVLGITQYITPGLGASSQYPFPVSMGRLFNQPAVSLLTLTSKLRTSK